MATDDKVLKVITRLESDQQSAQKARADIDRHQQGLEQLERRQQELTAVENRARSAEQQLAQARQAGQRETRDSREEVDRATDALHRYEEAAERAAATDRMRSQIDVGFSRAAGAVSSLDRIGSVGSQVLSGLGNSEAANVAGLLGDVAGAFTSLNPIMLGVTAAGVGLAAILGDVERRMQEAREAGEAFAQRGQAIADLAASGATSGDVQRQIARLEQAREASERYNRSLADLQAQYNSVGEQVKAAEDEIDRLLSRGATEGPEVEEAQRVQERINELEAQRADILRQVAEASNDELTSIDALNAAMEANSQFAKDAQTQIDDLNRGLSEGIFTANDAAEAAEMLAARERDLAAAQIAAANQALQVDRMTATQREERARQIEREIELLQREIDTGNASGAAADELRNRIINLNGEYVELTSVTESYADTLERARQAIERQKEVTDQFLDATTRYVDARQAAFEADQRHAESLIQRQQNIDRINADLQEKERALEVQAATAQLERERKLGLDRAQVAEEMQERILAAEERAGRASSNARARRDVLGAIAAEQQRKDEQAQAAKDAQKRFDDLKDNAAEQERIERLRNEESLRQARQTNERARILENEKARTEIAIRAQAAQVAAAQVANTEQNMLNIQAHHHRLMEAEAYRAGSAMVSAFQAGLGGRYTGGAAVGSTPYPTTQIPSSGTTKTANIVIQGTSQASIERQVVKTLKKVYS